MDTLAQAAAAVPLDESDAKLQVSQVGIMYFARAYHQGWSERALVACDLLFSDHEFWPL